MHREELKSAACDLDEALTDQAYLEYAGASETDRKNAQALVDERRREKKRLQAVLDGLKADGVAFYAPDIFQM